jgi:hypothetical protein
MFFVFLGNFVYWSPQLVTKSVFLTFLKIHEKAKIHLEVGVDIIWVILGWSHLAQIHILFRKRYVGCCWLYLEIFCCSHVVEIICEG